MSADPKDLVKELGDLLEVIDSILIADQIPRETVIKYQQKRQKEHGGFTQRIELIWTQTQPE